MVTIIILVSVYIFFIAIGTRFFVPHLGFEKSVLPKNIPDNLQEKINELNRISKDNYDYLKNAYEFLISKYHGDRVKTLTRFWYLFGDPFRFQSGFIPCTVFNYFLRIMLVRSGRFQEKSIRLVVVPFNLIIHQYLKIKINDKWINVDPWSKTLGISFSKRSFLFG